MMELALRTAIVFGSAFVVAAALRRATPATRHLLWHVTMIIVVSAPLILPLMPRVALPGVVGSSMASLENNLSPVKPGDASAPSAGPGPRGLGPGARHGLEPQASSIEPALSLSLLWLSGTVVTSAWFVFGWLASRWIAARASRAPGALEMEARSIARELGLKLIPDVRLMNDARGPLIVGIFRPSILLPPLALEWDADRRRAVFAHEVAHVRRADTRTQALAHFACALYWFNPLAWMATHALRRERERACDDVVIAMGIRPSSYAQDLLEIAQASRTRFSPSAALAMARPTELEGRLLSVLSNDRRREPLRATRWVLTLSMALSAMLVLGAQLTGSAAPRITPEAVDHPPMALVWREMSRAGEEAVASDAEAIAPLVAALDDQSGQVRETAAIGLALRSSPEVIEPLLRALRDPDAQVREKAAIGLSLRRDPRVVDALLITIEDIDAQVREKAAIALGTSGDPRAIAALRTAIRDPDEQVREKAAMGIVLLTSSPMGPIDRGPIESGLTWALNAALRAIR